VEWRGRERANMLQDNVPSWTRKEKSRERKRKNKEKKKARRGRRSAKK
jgi:hypothetical protein